MVFFLALGRLHAFEALPCQRKRQEVKGCREMAAKVNGASKTMDVAIQMGMAMGEKQGLGELVAVLTGLSESQPGNGEAKKALLKA